MITRSYQVDEEVWRQARDKAQEQKFSMSAIIRALLKMWIEGKIEIIL